MTDKKMKHINGFTLSQGQIGSTRRSMKFWGDEDKMKGWIEDWQEKKNENHGKDFNKLCYSNAGLQKLQAELIGLLRMPMSAYVSPRTIQKHLNVRMQSLQEARRTAGSPMEQILLECTVDHVISADRTLRAKFTQSISIFDLEDMAIKPPFNKPIEYN